MNEVKVVLAIGTGLLGFGWFAVVQWSDPFPGLDRTLRRKLGVLWAVVLVLIGLQSVSYALPLWLVLFSVTGSALGAIGSLVRAFRRA